MFLLNLDSISIDFSKASKARSSNKAEHINSLYGNDMKVQRNLQVLLYLGLLGCGVGKTLQNISRFGSPHSTNDHRSRISAKKVRTEYPLITFISVVGTVGGTLGMFVGILFVSIAEVLVSTFLVKIRE